MARRNWLMFVAVSCAATLELNPALAKERATPAQVSSSDLTPSKQDTIDAIATIWHDCDSYDDITVGGETISSQKTLPTSLMGNELSLPQQKTTSDGTKNTYVNRIDLTDLDRAEVKERGKWISPAFWVYCRTYACAFGNTGLGQQAFFSICSVESGQRLAQAIMHLAEFFPRRKPSAF